MGANTFSHCDSCPGPFPLQDIKHDNTYPSVITGAGERLNQERFQGKRCSGKMLCLGLFKGCSEDYRHSHRAGRDCLSCLLRPSASACSSEGILCDRSKFLIMVNRDALSDLCLCLQPYLLSSPHFRPDIYPHRVFSLSVSSN